MNQSVPNWSMENIVAPSEKKSLGVDNELVELLWRDGQVVQQSQGPRKQGLGHDEMGQKRKFDHPIRGGQSFTNLSSLIDEDETPSWMQFPLDDSLGGDFCSSFFSELANSNPIEKERAVKHFGALEETNVPPTNGAPRLQQPVFRQPGNLNKSSHDPNFGGLGRLGNFPHFSRQIKAEIPSSNAPVRGSPPVFASAGDTGESSIMTIGSSHCGSNQVNEASIANGSTANKETTRKVFPRCEGGLTETLETTITSSSGGSGGSYTETEKQPLSIKRHKRKGREAEESESQSEGAEFESGGANKAPQQSGSTRRSRAAEVHNLSERRRRDRINEKMKALQELIPHCNKSDKASMLDEAIEYLKSLQLQVQMMWMGGGMAPPMMFPGVQHYMSRMNMGMGTHPALPSIHNPIQMPTVPPLNQSMTPALLSSQPAMCSPVLNGVNFQNRMQNCDFSQPYAQHRGFNHIQVPQLMNTYGYGSQIPQQSPDIRLTSNSAVPSQDGALAANKPSSKLG